MLSNYLSTNSKNVLTLILGVGGGQLISILAVFVYTRLYEPENIGVLGIFLSFVIVLRLLANGGFEAAIVLPKSDKEAENVLSLCFCFNGLVVLLSLLIVIGSDYILTMIYGDSERTIQKVIWLLPFSVLFESGALALKYWLNRFKKYRVISLARFAQAIATAAISIGLGWQGYLVDGLIVGLVVGQGVQWLWMLLGSQLSQNWTWNSKEILIVFRKYRQFLQYGVLGTWFNSLASEAPFFILPRYFGEGVTGLFNVARKVLFAPINLVGGSISTIYFEQASKAYNDGGDGLRILTKSTLRNMLLMGILPTIILFLWAAPIFAIAFGEDYREAGIYASWLMPWIFIKFISHPLSYLIDIKMKLPAQLFYNLVLFVGQAGILIAMGLCCLSLTAVIGYGMVGCILSGIYLIYLLKLGEIY